MLILSIDSSGFGCGACLWHDGAILAGKTETMERGQDQRLLPLIQTVMADAKTDFAGLDRIAVTTGPGSFTGLRIGLAAARGIGLAAEKTVIGIDRFSIYRAAIKGDGQNLLVVINSRRAELYCRFYPAGNGNERTFMMNDAEIGSFLNQHPGTLLAEDMPLSGIADGRSIAESETSLCATLAAKADPNDPAFLPRPLYIRPPDVTFSGTRSRQ